MIDRRARRKEKKKAGRKLHKERVRNGELVPVLAEDDAGGGSDGGSGGGEATEEQREPLDLASMTPAERRTARKRAKKRAKRIADRASKAAAKAGAAGVKSKGGGDGDGDEDGSGDDDEDAGGRPPLQPVSAADDEPAAPAAIEHPFPTHPDDHCETPALAYAHIAPLLSMVAAGLGVQDAQLRIYDPYYCDGAVCRGLAEAGFPTVRNVNTDCYDEQARGAVPEFDAIVTNPPYSSDTRPDGSMSVVVGGIKNYFGFENRQKKKKKKKKTKNSHTHAHPFTALTTSSACSALRLRRANLFSCLCPTMCTVSPITRRFCGKAAARACFSSSPKSCVYRVFFFFFLF
jgi:hypothetical protein